MNAVFSKWNELGHIHHVITGYAFLTVSAVGRQDEYTMLTHKRHVDAWATIADYAELNAILRKSILSVMTRVDRISEPACLLHYPVFPTFSSTSPKNSG